MTAPHQLNTVVEKACTDTFLHLLKKCLKTNIANKLLQLKLMVQYFSASTAIEVTSMIDNDIIFGAYDPSQVRLSEVPLMSYRHYLNTSSWPQFLFSLHMKLYDSHLSVTEVEQVIYYQEGWWFDPCMPNILGKDTNSKLLYASVVTIALHIILVLKLYSSTFVRDPLNLLNCLNLVKKPTALFPRALHITGMSSGPTVFPLLFIASLTY